MGQEPGIRHLLTPCGTRGRGLDLSEPLFLRLGGVLMVQGLEQGLAQAEPWRQQRRGDGRRSCVPGCPTLSPRDCLGADWTPPAATSLFSPPSQRSSHGCGCHAGPVQSLCTTLTLFTC